MRNMTKGWLAFNILVLVWLVGTVVQYSADGCQMVGTQTYCGITDSLKQETQAMLRGNVDTGSTTAQHWLAGVSSVTTAQALGDRFVPVGAVWLVGFLLLTALWFMTRSDERHISYEDTSFQSWNRSFQSWNEGFPERRSSRSFDQCTLCGGLIREGEAWSHVNHGRVHMTCWQARDQTGQLQRASTIQSRPQPAVESPMQGELPSTDQRDSWDVSL